MTTQLPGNSPATTNLPLLKSLTPTRPGWWRRHVVSTYGSAVRLPLPYFRNELCSADDMYHESSSNYRCHHVADPKALVACTLRSTTTYTPGVRIPPNARRIDNSTRTYCTIFTSYLQSSAITQLSEHNHFHIHLTPRSHSNSLSSTSSLLSQQAPFSLPPHKPPCASAPPTLAKQPIADSPYKLAYWLNCSRLSRCSRQSPGYTTPSPQTFASALDLCKFAGWRLARKCSKTLLTHRINGFYRIESLQITVLQWTYIQITIIKTKLSSVKFRVQP